MDNHKTQRLGIEIPIEEDEFDPFDEVNEAEEELGPEVLEDVEEEDDDEEEDFREVVREVDYSSRINERLRDAANRYMSRTFLSRRRENDEAVWNLDTWEAEPDRSEFQREQTGRAFSVRMPESEEEQYSSFEIPLNNHLLSFIQSQIQREVSVRVSRIQIEGEDRNEVFRDLRMRIQNMMQYLQEKGIIYYLNHVSITSDLTEMYTLRLNFSDMLAISREIRMSLSP